MSQQPSVFSPAEISVLFKAARDVLAAAKGSSTRIPILFIGDSPSWIYKAYVALGLDRVHPARQLPITGHLDDLASPKVLKLRVDSKQMEAYYRKILLPLFPNGLPACIPVVDYTAQSSGMPWSSVDVLELFFKAIARQCYKQKIVPSFHLLRMVDKTTAQNSALLKPVAMRSTLIRMASPPSTIRQNFVFRLADDRYPRGMHKLKREHFEDADLGKLQADIINNVRYKKAIAQIYVVLREMQALKAAERVPMPGQQATSIRPLALPVTAVQRKVQGGGPTNDYDRRRPTNEWLRKRRSDEARSGRNSGS